MKKGKRSIRISEQTVIYVPKTASPQQIAVMVQMAREAIAGVDAEIQAMVDAAREDANAITEKLFKDMSAGAKR